jgi:disulfide bond formation protein DsbB
MPSEKSDVQFLYLAWVVAATATLGSLFFSEVMQLPPCVLCWYQRIFMYPMTVILTVGIIKHQKEVVYYILPLACMGLAIAIYHNLLYYGLIEASIVPCTSGVSCTSRQIEWFGFITIPLLSLSAFVIILVFIYLHRRNILIVTNSNYEVRS